MSTEPSVLLFQEKLAPYSYILCPCKKETMIAHARVDFLLKQSCDGVYFGREQI